MNVSTNNLPEMENQEAFPLNEQVEKLTHELLHSVIPVSYRHEADGTIRTLHCTLIGYWYAFKHPFRYVPRHIFLPVFDMDRRRWITLRTDSILFNSSENSEISESSENSESFESSKPSAKDTLIIHCSATHPGQDVGAADIDRWHRERGFDCIGYHYVVRLDGTIETGRPYDRDGAHALGWNHRAVGICYIGGYDAQGRPADTRTPQQRSALIRLIISLKKEHPELIRILGHRDVARKACPCFDAAQEYGKVI